MVLRSSFTGPLESSECPKSCIPSCLLATWPSCSRGCSQSCAKIAHGLVRQDVNTSANPRTVCGSLRQPCLHFVYIRHWIMGEFHNIPELPCRLYFDAAIKFPADSQTNNWAWLHNDWSFPCPVFDHFRPRMPCNKSGIEPYFGDGHCTPTSAFQPPTSNSAHEKLVRVCGHCDSMDTAAISPKLELKLVLIDTTYAWDCGAYSRFLFSSLSVSLSSKTTNIQDIINGPAGPDSLPDVSGSDTCRTTFAFCSRIRAFS